MTRLHWLLALLLLVWGPLSSRTTIVMCVVLLPCNVLRIGATRKGKSMATARDVVESDGAELILDPHKDSLAQTVLEHADGNLLYVKFSDVRHRLGFEILTPSTDPDSVQRQIENRMRAEAFVEMLLRRREQHNLAATPLLEEWVMAAIMLFLHQSGRRKPLPWIQYAFQPGTKRFDELLRDCTLPDIRDKFAALRALSPRALRTEVGSAIRLIGGVVGNPIFAHWSSGGFDLGAFYQQGGKVIVERGDEVGDDTTRVLMGALVQLTVEHAKRRRKPHPIIRIRIDEITNAGLYGPLERRGPAETNKLGLYWEYLDQNLEFPGGSDRLLNNFHRHEFFGCPNHDLARKAAIDLAAGLDRGEDESRAEMIERLTRKIMNLPPGWRSVRDASGSRFEYVPLLENPWPEWPGLREAKLREKLAWIHARPEYGGPSATPSSTSSDDTPPPPPNSPNASSAAARWRAASARAAGSSSSDGGGASGSSGS